MVTNFSQADPGRGGWEGDISYKADFLASLRLGDLAFPSRSSPSSTLSRRDAKPQRFSKAISIGLHHVGILPEKTRLICHRFRWYERLAPSATKAATKWEHEQNDAKHIPICVHPRLSAVKNLL